MGKLEEMVFVVCRAFSSVAAPLSIVFSILVLFAGVLLILKPGLVIEAQAKFCKERNWKMPQVSRDKEIRNTLAMGVIMMLTIVVVIVSKSSL